MEESHERLRRPGSTSQDLRSWRPHPRRHWYRQHLEALEEQRVRSSKWCSVHKSTNHSDAECRKRKEENKKPTALPAQANFAHVGTSFLPANSGPPYPTFGFSFAAGESSSGPGRVAPPAGTAAPALSEPSLLPGTAAATPLPEEDSPCGLFGAFGVSLMATSGAAPPAVDDGLSPSCVTVMVDSGSCLLYTSPSPRD